MSSGISALIYRVWNMMRDVMRLQHKAMHSYTYVSFALFVDDELEEVGKFFYILSEEKQDGYNKLLHMMGKLWYLRCSHSVPIIVGERILQNIESDLNLNRSLKLHPRNLLCTQDSNYKNSEEPMPPKRNKVLSNMQFIMGLEQRLHKNLRKLYNLAANLKDPEDPENWSHPQTMAAPAQHCVSMIGRRIRRQRCTSFYSWTLELCDLLKTDFLKQEEEVLQEIQAHLDSVLRMLAQQEHSQHFPESLKTKD